MSKYLFYAFLYWALPFSVLTNSLDDLFSHYTVLQICDGQTDVNCPDSQFVPIYSNNTNFILHLEVKGDSYRIPLVSFEYSAFVNDMQITTEDNGTISNSTHINFSNLQIYEGLDVNGTYACGYVSNNTFKGFLMLNNGSSIYIEPISRLNHTAANESPKLVAYRGSDVKFKQCSSSNSSNCRENTFSGSVDCKKENRRKVSCFLNAFEADNIPRLHFASNDKTAKTTRNPPLHRSKNSSCSVSLTVDSSFYASHHFNLENTLAELLLIMKHADLILRSTDFDGDGHPDGLTLRIRSVTLRQNERVGNKTVETDESLPNLVEEFRRVPQDDCVSLMLVSLQTESNFVTVAYGGGVCKSNDKEPEPARNVAIVNNVDSSGSPRPLFVTVWTATMAIGQVMGSTERACNTKELYPSEDWTAFFSKCRRDNIASMLERQGSCLESLERGLEIHTKLRPDKTKNLSLCGNGQVDTGEECDCGSKEQCKIKSSCCAPPGEKKECRYDRAKGYECDWPDNCCTRECKMVPKSWNQFCGSGESSCSPDGAYCNGKGPHCPIPRSALSLKDGERCGPATLKQAGAATCKGGRCTSTVCKDAGLQDCTCAVTSRQECRVCCKKRNGGNHTKESPELCVPAEYFGLTAKNGRLFYRYPGTPCTEVRFGHCNGFGVCVQYQNFGVSAAKIMMHISRSVPILMLFLLFILNSVVA